TLTREQFASYTIVVPYNADSALSGAANSLQKLIENAIGVKLEIKKEPPTAATSIETDYEIILGEIDRDEVRSFYTTLKKEDAGYALVGKKLLILGYSGNDVSRSVIQFRVNVLDKINSLDVLMKAGDSNVVAGKYAYQTLLVNGVDIANYKIVYPQLGNKGESEIASYLQNHIAEQTGYVIACVDDSAESSAYEIQVGDTARVTDAMRSQRTSDGFGNGKTYVGIYDKTVWLSGEDRSGIYLSYTKLLSLISTEGDRMALELTQSVCTRITSVDLSVMNYNVYYDLNDKKRNPDDVIVSIGQKSPDVFGLNEAGADWLRKMDAAFENVYGAAKGKPVDDASDASYNPIYYKKDKFDLVESGTKWLSDTPDRQSKYPDAKHYKTLTYAILKDRATGASFMYINVHFDGSNDSAAHSALKEVRKKQVAVLLDFTAGYTNLPIVVGGDFNEGTSSAVVTSMSSGDRFRYAASIAEQKTIVNSTNVNSEFDALQASVLDYVFVTSDSVSVKRYEQCDNKINGKYPSDHLPVYAEVNVYY
ncbi:MAG: endonuclease/exonuclease/phosphatase family protein, partial [Clostridia bacterium]|nr:endonuclease/exonuclease/phosphatase family protein [Clostridia bacterium]